MFPEVTLPCVEILFPTMLPVVEIPSSMTVLPPDAMTLPVALITLAAMLPEYIVK